MSFQDNFLIDNDIAESLVNQFASPVTYTKKATNETVTESCVIERIEAKDYDYNNERAYKASFFGGVVKNQGDTFIDADGTGYLVVSVMAKNYNVWQLYCTANHYPKYNEPKF